MENSSLTDGMKVWHNNITAEEYSFREKLSYVTNIPLHNNICFKLRTVLKLIFSRGKCDLEMTLPNCAYLLVKKETCLFSRKVTPLIDKNVLAEYLELCEDTERLKKMCKKNKPTSSLTSLQEKDHKAIKVYISIMEKTFGLHEAQIKYAALQLCAVESNANSLHKISQEDSIQAIQEKIISEHPYLPQTGENKEAFSQFIPAFSRSMYAIDINAQLAMERIGNDTD